MDKELENKLSSIEATSKEAFRALLAHFEKKQPSKVSYEYAHKYRYAKRCGFPLPKKKKILPPKKKQPKKKKRSIVGRYLERQSEAGNQKEINPMIMQGYKEWEFSKKKNETLAEANERMRIAALPLLERMKFELLKPQENFHYE